RGLQNLWWEFDSLIPCSAMTLEALILLGFRRFLFWGKMKRSQRPSQTGMIPIFNLKKRLSLRFAFSLFRLFCC
ncbi:hypothetical protein, partial [Ruminococcus sp. 5_1_39BFAA]|uniref:hypothetical protein n=1 Tax=Ruminococcus sp. 5_1_39BFAA TaxID=457412 RepID=UPI003565F5A4